MLKILIAKDDAQLATTLKYLVEDNPRYRVAATADDLDSARRRTPNTSLDRALVDLRPPTAPPDFRSRSGWGISTFLFLHYRQGA